MFHYVIYKSKSNITNKYVSGVQSALKSGMIFVPNCILAINPLA